VAADPREPGRWPGNAVCALTRFYRDFRRTAVRNLERANVPRSVAMRLVGHKTQSIYSRYAIASQQDLKEGVAKLAALHRADTALVLRQNRTRFG
jgi:hypothetical protein